MQYIYLHGKDEEKQKPELVLIRGIQGSGKTTLAKKVSELGYQHHENDQFFTNEQGEYQFDFSKHQLAKEQTLEKTKRDLEKGLNVVVSNTFNTLNELNVYIDMAKKVGANINVIQAGLNYGNVHNIPTEIVEKARQTYEVRHLDQKVVDPNTLLVKGPNQMTSLMYQSELKNGENIPRLLIKDSIERLKLAYSYTNHLFANSEPNTQYQEVVFDDKASVKEVLSMLSIGRVNEAIEKMEEGSIYARSVLMPQEFMEIIKKDQDLKEKIEHVLVSYFVDSPKAQEEDQALSMEIYQKQYQLGAEKKVEPVLIKTQSELFVKDSMNTLKDSVQKLKERYLETDKAHKQSAFDDYYLAKEVYGVLAAGYVDEAIEKMKKGSQNFTANFEPKDFIKAVKSDPEIKDKVKEVLISYFVNSIEAEKEDRVLTASLKSPKQELNTVKVENTTPKRKLRM